MAIVSEQLFFFHMPLGFGNDLVAIVTIGANDVRVPRGRSDLIKEAMNSETR